MIDLRSDTVTKPTREMREAMMAAEVGDAVMKEDPTVNKLEAMTAAMFGKEAALFCPSGTMSNQIAIAAYTRPGDEVICHRLAHVYVYEGGGIARNSGASVRLIEGDQGRFTLDQVKANINPDDIHNPITRLVEVENTVNKGGGAVWDLEQLKKISEFCHDTGLAFHLDGARIFNALIATGQTPLDHGKLFDSISVCLSKGLGAPVGSVLLGDKEFIQRANRIRKVMGGGMRQAGILAAAGIYALEHNINRLAEDHKKAKRLETELKGLSWVEEILPVATNIVIFRIHEKLSEAKVLEKLKAKGFFASSVGSKQIRFVTHLDFTDHQLEEALQILKGLQP